MDRSRQFSKQIGGTVLLLAYVNPKRKITDKYLAVFDAGQINSFDFYVSHFSAA